MVPLLPTPCSAFRTSSRSESPSQEITINGATKGTGEQYVGLLKRRSDGRSNYDGQENQSIARNLNGHPLFMHGTADDNVPLQLTLLVVDALIRANKDFDLLLLPDQHHMHDGQSGGYATRRRWDYFVRYLLGAEPPEYELQPPPGS